MPPTSAIETAVADLPRNPPALTALDRIAEDLAEHLRIIRATGQAVCADHGLPISLVARVLANHLGADPEKSRDLARAVARVSTLRQEIANHASTLAPLVAAAERSAREGLDDCLEAALHEVTDHLANYWPRDRARVIAREAPLVAGVRAFAERVAPHGWAAPFNKAADFDPLDLAANEGNPARQLADYYRIIAARSAAVAEYFRDFRRAQHAAVASA